jgi:fructose/tagatose bisphosphate aldolase
MNRLNDIRFKTGSPILLHGGTGILAEQIHQAIERGIAMINMASKVQRTYMGAVNERPRETPILPKCA